MRTPRPARARGPRAAWCSVWLAAALTAAPALADPAPVKLVEGNVALEYRRSSGSAACPDEAALRERAADSFDFRDPFVPQGSAAGSRMRIEVTRAPGVYRGTIAVLGAGGEVAGVSTEQHVNCDALVWVLAHRVGLAVLRRPVRPPAPPSVPVAPPPVAPAAPPAGSPPPRRCDERCIEDLARRISAMRVTIPAYTVTAGAGVLTTAGFSADLGPGFWVGAALQRRWFSLGAEARGFLPAPAVTFDLGRASEISSISGLLVPCLRWRIFSGCAAIEAGVMFYKLPSPLGTIDRAFFGLGPRAGVDVLIDRALVFRVFADLIFRPVTPTFSVLLWGGEGAPLSTWKTPATSGVLSLGLAWTD
jgi:hypothetical protein